MSWFSVAKLADFYEMLSCDWSVVFVFVDSVITDL